MGCGSSSTSAAQEPRPRAQACNAVELAPGQSAIICNCPNARLNGEQVILQEYNQGLGEWTVKGNKFPLSIGMSLGAQFLEAVQPAPTLLTTDGSLQRKEHTCPSGHVLKRHEAPNSDYRCDVCDKEVAEGETLWGCRVCDYDKCQQCANGIVEFTDTDGDKVMIHLNDTHGMAFCVNGKKVVDNLIKLRVSDHNIILEGDSADRFAATTVPVGQEYILKQALNLFVESQSEKVR